MFRADGSYFCSVFCFQVEQVAALFSLGFNTWVLSAQRQALQSVLFTKRQIRKDCRPVLCKEASQTRTPLVRTMGLLPREASVPEGRSQQSPLNPTSILPVHHWPQPADRAV